MWRLTRGHAWLAVGGILLAAVVTAALLAVDRSGFSRADGSVPRGFAAPVAGAIQASAVDRVAVARRAGRPLPRPVPVSAAFPDALTTVEDFDLASVFDYGLLGTPSAGPHHLFLAHKRGGGVCLVDLLRQSWAIGCNAELFSTQPVMFEETFAGGPSPDSMRGIVVAGIARPDVAELEIIDKSGATHHVPLTQANAFAFQSPDGSAGSGAQPSALVTRDKDGTEIGRITGLAVG